MSFLCRPKSEEADCGDCVSVFENREDYYYAMLSDGMGSGSEAALTSSVCSVFLKKMLSAGNAKDISIEMLNDLVRSSRSECSATIDLFELDMLTGKASFIKSGAAPSFLKRGGRLFRIQSKTLPVGIVRAADAEQVSYTVEHGDVIVMQSDGVAQSYEDCPWMANMLTRCWTDDLAVMCARILDAAEVNNAEKDDRSVCILRIIETK
jgi:stage II sporulation protein E